MPNQRMAIIDSRSVSIEISPPAGKIQSELRLNYRDQSYNLVQAFADRQLELVQQKWQQIIAADSLSRSEIDRYLVVKEIGYYSIWKLASNQNLIAFAESTQCNLELQQASIWLLQELWLQWQNLVGAKQLTTFVEQLLSVTTQLQSSADLDQLLGLDPVTAPRLIAWTDADFSEFDRQLYQLTQKKLGQQFAINITIDIIESMPKAWRPILRAVLDLQPQLSPQLHD